MNLNNPIPQEWDDYVTQTALNLEVIPDQLYDTQTMTAALTQLTFFTSVPANESISNLAQPGVLPNPESFLIQAPRIRFNTTVESVSGAAGALASQFNDIALLLNSGRMTLTIGRKIYGPWKLWMMPSGSGLQGQLAAAGATAANLAYDYGQTYGPLWGMFPHLMIAPLQPFRVDMFWPAVVAISASRPIEVLFDGQRARAVQ
jgi:hypothetical protein